MRRYPVTAPVVALLFAFSLALAPVARAEEPAKDPAHEAFLDALKKARSIEKQLIKAVSKVRTSSVSVSCFRERGEEMVLYSGGSGVLINKNRRLWVLTNTHVVRGAQLIRVTTHDGVMREVEIHDQIPDYDIALLKFVGRKRPPRLKGVAIKQNTSKRTLDEGSWVIATGNPFFLAKDGASVTTLGVVSGLDRFIGGQFQYVDAIQHDAEVNSGNSGGPLWNLNGDLVGINGKIATRSHIRGARPTNTGASFSLPIHQVAAFLTLLVKSSDAAAGYIGIDTETAKDAKGKAIGARVVRVDRRRSPMYQRGRQTRGALKEGDIIRALIVKGGSKKISTSTDFRSELSLLPAGTSRSPKVTSLRT